MGNFPRQRNAEHLLGKVYFKRAEQVLGAPLINLNPQLPLTRT